MTEAEAGCRGEEIPFAAVRRHGGEDLFIMRPKDAMLILSTLDMLATKMGSTMAEAIMEHGTYDEGW